MAAIFLTRNSWKLNFRGCKDRDGFSRRNRPRDRRNEEIRPIVDDEVTMTGWRGGYSWILNVILNKFNPGFHGEFTGNEYSLPLLMNVVFHLCALRHFSLSDRIIDYHVLFSYSIQCFCYYRELYYSIYAFCLLSQNISRVKFYSRFYLSLILFLINLLDLFRLTDWPISATWLHYPTWSVGIFCALRTLSRMEQCSKKAFTLSSATRDEGDARM